MIFISDSDILIIITLLGKRHSIFFWKKYLKVSILFYLNILTIRDNYNQVKL